MSTTEIKDLSKLCIHTITTKPWSLKTAVEKYSERGIQGITVWRQALEGIKSVDAKKMFDDNDAMLLGITVDNTPTLYTWTKNMCGVDNALWFPVFSDFYPHGEVAKKYGLLRSEGFTERALFVVDKKGIIRFIDIHDINEKPPLSQLRKALEDL